PDEADQALLPRLDRGLDGAARAEGLVPLDRVDQVVQLPEVDVVDAEPVEGAVQLLARGGGLPLARLGGEEELVPVLAQPGPGPELCVAVAGGDVDVVDAVLEQRLEGTVGDLLRHPREPGGSEDDTRALVAAAAEREAGNRHERSAYSRRSRRYA